MGGGAATPPHVLHNEDTEGRTLKEIEALKENEERDK